MPMFSIVIPTYNSAQWLKVAVESVQSQSFDDWEIVISDDASTDNTLDIANDMCRLDRRLKTVTRGDGLNRGAAAARNFGMTFASGSYVGFLDSDDSYTPECLSIVASLFDKDADLGVIYGRTTWVNSTGEVISEENLGFSENKTYSPPQLALDVVIKQKGAVPCTCAFFAKTSRVIICGGFEEQFRLYEDQSLWLKLLLREKTLLSDRVFGLYRQHQGSTSAKAAAAGIYTDGSPNRAEQQFLEWAQSECARAGVPNDLVEPAFADRLLMYRKPVRAYLKRKAQNAINRVTTFLSYASIRISR